MTTGIFDPNISTSWDSLEGVPDWSDVARPKKPAEKKTGPTPNAAYRGLEWFGQHLPGFVLAASLAIAADYVAGWIGHQVLHYDARVNPISGVPIAIALGILLCNSSGVPALFQPGLKLCMRQLQRFAIMLLGFRLSLGMVGSIGLTALPIVICSVGIALFFIPWFAGKMGLTRRLGTLIAVGTSICGVSAIMAVAPTIDAEEGEVSYAVTCVAIFGMLAMLCYPYVVPFLFTTSWPAGVFFGTAIHDTAQVTGSALVYSQIHNAPEVLNTATVVKIIRNLSMVAVIPLMGAMFRRGDGSKGKKPGLAQLVPLFVLGFLGATVLRTVGDMTALKTSDGWTGFLTTMNSTSTWLLTVVMAAVGLGTGLAQLRKLGLRPFFVGLSAALVIGAASFGLIRTAMALGL